MNFGKGGEKFWPQNEAATKWRALYLAHGAETRWAPPGRWSPSEDHRDAQEYAEKK